MSPNSPFIFGGGGGQPPPPMPQLMPQQQQRTHQWEYSPQPQAQPTAARQVAFQQNAQLPGVDMSLLAGISPDQLAAIGQLFQTGYFNAPPAAGAQLGQGTAAATASVVTSAPQLKEPTRSFQKPVEATDTDKEEGELEEDDVGETPGERDFLRPPPTGPRNRSSSPRRTLPNANPRQSLLQPQGANQAISRGVPQRYPVQNPRQNGINGKSQSKKEVSERFILEMVKAGTTFDDIAQAVSNRKALIRLFKKLNLSVPMTPALSKPNSVPRGVVDTQPTSNRSAEETARVPVAKRTALSRDEYLARLQAAKTKTSAAAQSDAATTSTSTNTSKVVAESVKDAPTKAPSKPPKVAVPPLRPTNAAQITALARQRLEELKAKQAAEQNGTTTAPKSSPVPSSQSLTNISLPFTSGQPRVGLGSGLADISTRFTALRSQASSAQPADANTTSQPATAPSMFSPTPPTPTFGGLPGLFMASAIPQQIAPLASSNEHTATQQASVEPPNGTSTLFSVPPPVTRKRPVASDFDDIPAKRIVTKRPFGQSRNASEDESVIIHISDDEDEDTDDEMETDDAAELTGTPNVQTMSFRDVGPLRDFPPRPNFVKQPSAPSTPGGSTPGGVSYEQRLKEIEEMKRRIAEREAKKKHNGKPTATLENESAPVHTSPATGTPTYAESSFAMPDKESSSKLVNDAMLAGTAAGKTNMLTGSPANAPTHSSSLSVERPQSAAAAARLQQRDSLESRIHELVRDEAMDLDEAVEAAADRTAPEQVPTLFVPGDLPGIPVRDQPAPSAMTPSQGVRDQRLAGVHVHDSPSEDGELSDDSVSNLYADEENVATGESAVQELTEISQQMSHPDQQDRDASAGNTEADVIESQDGDLADSSNPFTLEVAPEDSNAFGQVDIDAVPQSDTQAPSSSEQSSDQLDAVGRDTVSHPMSYVEGDQEYLVDADDASEVSSVSDDDPILASTFDSPAGEEGKTAVAAAAISDSRPTESIVKFDLTADDLAPELQSSEAELANSSEQKPTKASTYYTPYESPLRRFKDYRWHTNFLNNISGGYKSLTYSHQIDPETPLCVYETAGGKCNDPTCPNQHFKDMGLLDNDLLQNLGMKNVPVNSPEELRNWKEGLANVIKQLKASGAAKDANVIAKRIAEYRREFIGDATKVINLG